MSNSRQALHSSRHVPLARIEARVAAILLAGSITGASTLRPAFGAEEVAVAKVNGVVIMKSRLYNYLTDYMMRNQKFEMSEEEKGRVLRQILKNVIDRELLLQDAEIRMIREDPEIAVKVKRFDILLGDFRVMVELGRGSYIVLRPFEDKGGVL